VDSPDLAALREVHAAELRNERYRARQAGHEYADELDLGIVPDPGAPMPHILANGDTVFVLFYLRPAVSGDGDTAIGTGRHSSEHRPIALVEFIGVHAVLFGGPNDEALSGHRLYGRGLEYYAIHEIRSSSWITEAQGVNSVHPHHQDGWHEWLRHFVITFHDETLECLARDVRTEVSAYSFPEAIRATANRMLDRWQA
jgi:hypothetical protein